MCKQFFLGFIPKRIKVAITNEQGCGSGLILTGSGSMQKHRIRPDPDPQPCNEVNPKWMDGSRIRGKKLDPLVIFLFCNLFS